MQATTSTAEAEEHKEESDSSESIKQGYCYEITDDGELFVWKENNPVRSMSNSPERYKVLDDVVSVSQTHTYENDTHAFAALTSNGDLYT